MQLPRLEIDNRAAYIGINQRQATLEIRQPKADVRMNQPQPEVEYIKTQSKLEIDQTEAFADANLKNPLRVVKEWAEKAKQKVLQSLSEVAAEGDRLMKIEERDKTVIPEIARQNSEPEQKRINIGFMPSSAEKVKFYYQPSMIDVKVRRGNFQIDIEPKDIVKNFKPGNLQVYLKQKAVMNIKVVGSTLDQKI